jgi:hypothetical protein
MSQFRVEWMHFLLGFVRSCFLRFVSPLHVSHHLRPSLSATADGPIIYTQLDQVATRLDLAGTTVRLGEFTLNRLFQNSVTPSQAMCTPPPAYGQLERHSTSRLYTIGTSG